MTMRRIVLTLCTLVALSVVAPSPVAAASCAQGGVCAIGAVGPGGGRVIHVASTPQWWGQYIEARPHPTAKGMPWSLRPDDSLYNMADGQLIRQRTDARALGMGGVNTRRIVEQNGVGRYAARIADTATIGRKSDWVLPSRDELDAMYHLVALGYWRDTIVRGAYWASSENSDRYAWYQLFQDGTQFTDENGVGKVNGISIRSNKNRTRSTRHGGSGFPSYLYRVALVRYFGPSAGMQPPVSQPALTGNSCTETGSCVVGDIGPAGGVVFYDAGVTRAWGRYLEAAPQATETSGLPWKKLSVNDRLNPIYVDVRGMTARLQRVRAKLIGQGEINTSRIVKRYRAGNYAARYAQALTVNGYDDWFLPSVDELDEMYRFMHANSVAIDNTRNTYYWSSSEYDYNNAWTINFKDGQEFDREKYLVPTPGVKALRIRAIRAFG